MPTITGTTGADEIIGTDDADDIDGLGGADSIFARGGNDFIRTSWNAREVFGGSGDDTISYGNLSFNASGITTVLDGGTGTDTLRLGSVNVINVTTSAERPNDLLIGTTAIATGFEVIVSVATLPAIWNLEHCTAAIEIFGSDSQDSFDAL